MRDKILQLISEIETRLDELRDLAGEDTIYETQVNKVTCSICGRDGTIEESSYFDAMATPNSIIICRECASKSNILKNIKRFN